MTLELFADGETLSLEPTTESNIKESKTKKINWANILIGRLENAGYKVYTRHLRLYNDWDDDKGRPVIRSGSPRDIKYKNTMLSMGGETQLTLETPEGAQHTASAICSPQDNYCNSTGRLIALKKILQDISYKDAVLRSELSRALSGV